MVRKALSKLYRKALINGTTHDSCTTRFIPINPLKIAKQLKKIKIIQTAQKNFTPPPNTANITHINPQRKSP